MSCVIGDVFLLTMTIEGDYSSYNRRPKIKSSAQIFCVNSRDCRVWKSRLKYSNQPSCHGSDHSVFLAAHGAAARTCGFTTLSSSFAVVRREQTYVVATRPILITSDYGHCKRYFSFSTTLEALVEPSCQAVCMLITTPVLTWFGISWFFWLLPHMSANRPSPFLFLTLPSPGDFFVFAWLLHLINRLLLHRMTPICQQPCHDPIHSL